MVTQTAPEMDLELQLSHLKSVTVQVLYPYAVNNGWLSSRSRDTDMLLFTGAWRDLECKPKRKHTSGLAISHTSHGIRQEEEQRLAPNKPSELSLHVEMQEPVPIHNKQEETSSLLILNLKDERHLL